MEILKAGVELAGVYIDCRSFSLHYETRCLFKLMGEPVRKLVLLLKEETHYWVNSATNSTSLTEKYTEAENPSLGLKHVRARSFDLTDNVSYGHPCADKAVSRHRNCRQSLQPYSPSSRCNRIIQSRAGKTHEIVRVKENKGEAPMTGWRPRLPFSVVQHPYMKIKREPSPEGSRMPMYPKILNDAELRLQHDRMWMREGRLFKK